MFNSILAVVQLS